MDFQTISCKLRCCRRTSRNEDILFEVVHEYYESMFTTNMALYVEMMGDNYHTEDIVGVAWGTPEKIYVGQMTLGGF